MKKSEALTPYKNPLRGKFLIYFIVYQVHYFILLDLNVCPLEVIMFL